MIDVFDDLLNEDYVEEWKEVKEVCYLLKSSSPIPSLFPLLD